MLSRYPWSGRTFSGKRKSRVRSAFAVASNSGDYHADNCGFKDRTHPTKKYGTMPTGRDRSMGEVGWAPVGAAPTIEWKGTAMSPLRLPLSLMLTALFLFVGRASADCEQPAGNG